MSIRAKFQFISEAGADSKSTVIKVKTIQLAGQEEVFLFPQEKRTSAYHTQLFNTTVVKNVVKSLKTRNKFRNVLVTLTEELQNIYLDEEGNVVLNEEYLEEVTTTSTDITNTSVLERSSRSLAKDMVLEKFNGENFKATTWLSMFVQECKRVGINQNKYAETLRLFLEKSALDWFNVSLKQNSLNNNWEIWNNAFIDTFSVQSWTDVAYAYDYQYLNGSLLEYALKKRNLLLEVNESMTLNTQIDLIVIKLPKFLQNRLERKSILTMEDLMSKLKHFGNLSIKKNDKDSDKISKQNKPCAICEKLGYKDRFHPEQRCRLKDKQISSPKNDKIKIINNVDSERIVASTEEAKNE